MRILVTGGSGMVGNYVESVFSDTECLLTNRRSLDICDKGSVLAAADKFKPDVILHLAAATDVDRCELEPDWALRTNVEGTRNVVDACKKNRAMPVFLSSGAVFNGQNPSPYTEADIPAPINVYGRTKLEAERLITGGLKTYLIIRAGWMIGGGTRDSKFVGKITRKMTGSASVKVVNDKFGSITYARDLLLQIRQLLNKGVFGIYHCVNHGMVSRYDIAVEIKGILGLEAVKVAAVSSDTFPMPAPRGRSEALDNLGLRKSGLDCMRGWKEALRDYLLNDFGLVINIKR